MKTAPVTRRPCDRAISRAWTHWSTISQVARFRRLGIRAVAQKSQAIAQPTCDERQTLTAPGLWSGIRTVSTARPSASGTGASEAVDRRSDRAVQGQAGQGADAIAEEPGDLELPAPGAGSWTPWPRIAEVSRRAARSGTPGPRARARKSSGGWSRGSHTLSFFPVGNPRPSDE